MKTNLFLLTIEELIREIKDYWYEEAHDYVDQLLDEVLRRWRENS